MWTHLPANLPHFSPFSSLQTKQPLPLCPSLDLSQDMEFAGNSAGGFHGYRRLPQTTADGAPDISMALPPQHNAAAASDDNANPNHNPNPNVNNNECVVREQDRFMPIANVIRIMRRILPPHAKISDDAKETIQECVSEYISFITSEANDRCQREQRKTITAEDVLWAMSKLGFDDYIEPLTLYLHRYREFDGGDRGALRGDHLMKPPPRPVVDHGYVGFPPGAFHHMGAPHPGFYGAAAPQLPPPMSLFKDSGNPGSSSACMEPYRQSKDQL